MNSGVVYRINIIACFRRKVFCEVIFCNTFVFLASVKSRSWNESLIFTRQVTDIFSEIARYASQLSLNMTCEREFHNSNWRFGSASPRPSSLRAIRPLNEHSGEQIARFTANS